MNIEKGDLPEEHLAEHYLILLKSARRCAYDLRHAADMLPSEGPDANFSQIFRDRAHQWIGIFAPDGIKNYKLELHQEMFRIECEVRRLIKLCKDNGVDADTWVDQ